MLSAERVVLTLGDVVAAVAAERSLSEGSGPWTVRMLEDADRRCGGRWKETTFRADELRSAWLAAHAGEPCRGDTLELVPAGGATVAATAQRLRLDLEAYQTANQSCWGRVEEAMSSPYSTLVLLAAERRVVLDGLHRLVGWELAGRLESNVNVRALVAVA